MCVVCRRACQIMLVISLLWLSVIRKMAGLYKSREVHDSSFWSNSLAIQRSVMILAIVKNAEQHAGCTNRPGKINFNKVNTHAFQWKVLTRFSQYLPNERRHDYQIVLFFVCDRRQEELLRPRATCVWVYTRERDSTLRSSGRRQC